MTNLKPRRKHRNAERGRGGSLVAAMYGEGHSRRFRDVRAAAALLSTTAVMLQCRERRDVPNADMEISLDHLVGEGEE
jgi:hypothetical protein